MRSCTDGLRQGRSKLRWTFPPVESPKVPLCSLVPSSASHSMLAPLASVTRRSYETVSPLGSRNQSVSLAVRVRVTRESKGMGMAEALSDSGSRSSMAMPSISACPRSPIRPTLSRISRGMRMVWFASLAQIQTESPLPGTWWPLAERPSDPLGEPMRTAENFAPSTDRMNR